MDLDCPHLSLAPHWAGERDPRRIFLVQELDALRLCRRGEYERVAPWQTLWQVGRERARLGSRLGELLWRNHPVPHDPTGRQGDELSAWAAQAIERGALVGVRRVWHGGDEGDATTDERRLVRDVERATRGALVHGGRRYKLVAGADEGEGGDRDSYEVVARDDAVRVLRTMVEESKGQPHLPVLLAEVGRRLSSDWRPPLPPRGMVLLRRIAARAVASTPAAALTPSQVRAMLGQASLAIHVVDLAGKAQAGLAFVIRKPDGGSERGRLDDSGRAQAESSAPGTFTVTFPDLDGDDWTGDGVLAVDQGARSEARRHKVEQGDRVSTIARAHGFARWQTIWDFAGNAALRTLRGTAHVLKPNDEVVIPSKLERSAEVPGGTAKYVVQVAPEPLRVRFAGLTPTAAVPITFAAKPDTGELVEGPLGAGGWMAIDLPPGASKVNVDLFRGGDDADTKPIATYELRVGEIDPLEELSGIQARLANLGYYHGAITGQLDDRTRDAVAHFRWARLRDGKHAIDGDLLQALRGAYGV